MPTLDPDLYTVAWIAPLEIEVQAALQMLDKVHTGGFLVSPGDDYVFHAGEIQGHNIVIAIFAAGQPYGTSSAMSLASYVRNFFPNLWFGLLVVALSEGDYPAILLYSLGKQKRASGFKLLHYKHSLPQTIHVVSSVIGKIQSSLILVRRTIYFTHLVMVHQLLDNADWMLNTRACGMDQSGPGISY
ncbi:hypothetical protein BDW60DRAFT_201717 [Aspergillus nidulans var. acristatus]